MLHPIKWHNVTHKSSWPDLFLKNAMPLVSFVYNLNLKARLCRHIWTSQEAQCLCRVVLPLGGCSSVTGCIRQLSALPWGATMPICTQWGMLGAPQPQGGKREPPAWEMIGLISLHSQWKGIIDTYLELPRWLSSKESACNGGDASSILGLGRFPGAGRGNPL